MKMIYCTCNISVLDEVKNLLDEQNVSDYQVIEKVTVKNRIGDPRYDTPVWPGYNALVLLQVGDEAKVQRVITAIRSYNKQVFNHDELITVCTWTIDDYYYD